MASEAKKTIGQEIDEQVRQAEAEAKQTTTIAVATVLMDLVTALRKSKKRTTTVDFQNGRDYLLQPTAEGPSPAFIELQQAARDQDLAIHMITKHACGEYGTGQGACNVGCTYYAYSISVALPGDKSKA